MGKKLKDGAVEISKLDAIMKQIVETENQLTLLMRSHAGVLTRMARLSADLRDLHAAWDKEANGN